jgi:hypothetical protein
VNTDPIGTALVSWNGPEELVTQEVLKLWVAVEPALTNDAARAAVADFLWERRVGRAVDHAMLAVESYLAWAAARGPSLASTDATVRAWDVARSIKNVRAVESAELVALSSATTGVGLGEYNPGVTLPLLDLLTSPQLAGQANRDGVKAEVGALLERALEAYSLHDAGAVIALMERRAADPGAVAALRVRHVELLLGQARSTPEGLLRQTRLEGVIDVARRYGLSEFVEQATVELQRIDTSSLGLQRIATTQGLPVDVWESQLDRFTCGRSWRDGLDAFLFGPPPTGSRAALEKSAHDYLSAGYFHTMLGTVTLTEEGLPSHSSEAGDKPRAVAFQASVRAGIYGRVLATGLRRAADRFGVPSVEDLRAHLVHRGAGELALADALARALHHFWAGDYDSALHVITPRVETAARSLLRECDVAIYRTQVGKSKGGYVGMFALVEQLEALSLDPDWAYFLRYTFVNTHGMHIRDNVAHGLITRADEVATALVLRAAAMLILITGPAAQPTWTDEDGPSATTGVVARDRGELERLLGNPLRLPDGGVVAATVRLLQECARVLERAAVGLMKRARR